MTTHTRWTSERLDELRALRAQGLSRAECGARMGLNVDQIKRGITNYGLRTSSGTLPPHDRLHPSGIRPKGLLWFGERLDELQRLVDQDDPRLTYGEIALRMGCTKNTVAGAIWRHVLSQRASPPPAVVIEFSDHGCRWPVGHPNEPGFHFCGAPTVRGTEGKIWCCDHRNAVYMRVKVSA